MQGNFLQFRKNFGQITAKQQNIKLELADLGAVAKRQIVKKGGA